MQGQRCLSSRKNWQAGEVQSPTTPCNDKGLRTDYRETKFHMRQTHLGKNNIILSCVNRSIVRRSREVIIPFYSVLVPFCLSSTTSTKKASVNWSKFSRGLPGQSRAEALALRLEEQAWRRNSSIRTYHQTPVPAKRLCQGESRIFTVMHSRRTRNNWHELKLEQI